MKIHFYILHHIPHTSSYAEALTLSVTIYLESLCRRLKSGALICQEPSKLIMSLTSM